MTNEELVSKITQEVLKKMDAPSAGTTKVSSSTASAGSTGMDKSNYPLGEKSADKIYSSTGRKLSEMTMQQVLDGELKAEDIRIAPETLNMQDTDAPLPKWQTITFAEFCGNSANLITSPVTYLWLVP